jgi:hypothetical protein
MPTLVPTEPDEPDPPLPSCRLTVLRGDVIFSSEDP